MSSLMLSIEKGYDKEESLKLVKKVSYQNQPFYLTNTYQENVNNYQTINNNSIETNYCPNCGVQITKENFYHNCGYKL